MEITDIGAWCAIEFATESSNPLYYAHNLYCKGSLVKELIIPDGFTEVKPYAFDNCSNLTSVTIPEGVTSIGSSAFYFCSNLTSVTIPEGVTSIGDCAFSSCRSLTSVTIPEGVTSIGSSAFSYCDSLTSVTILEGVTSIGKSAFSYCYKLATIIFEGSAPSIYYNSFYNVTANVYFPLDDVSWDDSTMLQYGGKLTWKTQKDGSVRYNYKAASCTQAGNTAYWYLEETGKYYSDAACTIEIQLESTVIPALNHSRKTKTAASASTCTRAGNKEYWYCPDCGKYFLEEGCITPVSYSETIISAINHSNKTRTAASAVSCTENGNIEYWYCPDCDKYYSDEACVNAILLSDTIINAVNHANKEHYEAKAESCTEAGNPEYWYCSQCEKYFSDAECTTEIVLEDTVIPASHEFGANHICTVCGEPDGVNAFGGYCGEEVKWTLDSDGVLRMFGSGSMSDYAEGASPWADHAAAVSTLQIENGITYIGKNAFYGLEGISEAKMPDSVVKISSGAFRGCVNLESIIVPEGTEIEDAAFEGTKIISAAIKALSFEKQGESYVIDASKNSSVQLETQFSPDAAAAKVWESSNKSVAEVDETGLVTFKLPGTVTITVSAAENPEQAAGVSMDVFFADRAQALRLDANAKCAMVGETIAVTPWGENALSAELFSWTIISGGEYAVMTRPGVFNVVKGGGTVTVKAGLIGDPLNRSASISFTTEAAPNKVKLICEDSELTEIVNDFNAPDRELIYRITPVAQAESGIYKFKAAASDKNLVTVKDLKDGSFNVVLSNKNVGACTVTFTPYAKVNGKDVAQTPVTLEVYIRDYAPKTETSVTMNTYKQESMYLPVAESADNAIVPGTVEVLDCNVKGTVSPATNLKAEYKDGYLELTALDVIAKTGKYRFVFNTAKGEYTADFSLKVANAYPKLTLKQENVLKLYDASDKAVVAITAADGAKLSAVEYTGKGYDCYAEGNAAVFSRNSEALKSGKLNVSLEGYRGTIAASVTVKTIAKPALSLSVTSSNVCAGKEYSISFKIYDKNSKKNLEGCTVSCNGFTIENNGEDYVLRPVDCNAFSGKTVLNVKVSEPGWNIAPLVLKYTLNAERSVLPTVKLKATSLSMNSAYPEVTNETELVLSQSNAAVTASFSCQTVNPDKLKVQYDSSTGKVVVRFTGEGTPVPAGSYKFTGTVKCGNVALKPITLTVKVVNVEASVTAKAAGKLDVTNPDSRLVYTLTTKNLWGSYKLASAEVLNAVTGETMDDFTAETGKDGKNNTTVSLSIKEGMKYGLNGKLSTYNVKLKLKLEGTEKTLITPKLTIKPTQSTLKVKADAATLNVYQSQAENRTVVYTVRVTGPSGAKIDEVTLGSFNAVFTKNLAEAALDLAWSIAPDGKSVKVYVTLKSLSRLGAGKSLALPLVFVPEGAVDAKANAKLNLNLKVMK